MFSDTVCEMDKNSLVKLVNEQSDKLMWLFLLNSKFPVFVQQ